MGCVAATDTNRNLKMVTKTTKLSELELELLNMIYSNLACRCRNNIVLRETFDVFFHSSGLIGQILFLKFDRDKNGIITLEQFCQTFELMLKGSMRARADVLFGLYDIGNSGGVTFQQLLKILFSYHLAELNQMLIEESFLKYIGQDQLAHYFGAFGAEHRHIEEKDIIEQQSEISQDPSRPQSNIKQTVVRTNSQTLQIPTNVKKNQQTVEKAQAKKSYSIVMKKSQLKKNIKHVKIKSNVSTLTKKYATFLFYSNGLDIKKDTFSRQMFYKLIQDHPALFNVYLSGFHTYIWLTEAEEPRYNSITPWIQGKARMVYRQDEDLVYLKYINSTIFVFWNKKSKKPIDIISLEGLTVDKIDKSKRFGIVFKHRDGLYHLKQYYFNEKQTQYQWLKQLAQFKQSSIFDNYTKMQRIGGGSFASVFKGKSKKDNKQIAIKVIESFKLTPSQKQVIKRQTSLLQQCHHPNIVKFIAEYKTKTHIYIITELVNDGDLFEHTKKTGFLQEYEAALIFGYLIDVICYINNDLGIIHRDLKPQNILIALDEDKTTARSIKLIDFGFGVFKDKVKELPLQQKYAGTPGYIAPEIYKQEDYDQKIDTFSLGIILYFMLSGNLPFQSNFIEEITELTVNCTFTMENAHWSNVSNDAKDLIKRILTFREERISTKDIERHPWLQNMEQLKKLKGVNRKARIF